MTYLALDLGEKRIGVAISESGLIATPHGIIQRSSQAAEFAQLQALIDEFGVTQIVVGMPYSLSGHDLIGPQAQWVQSYTAAMAQAINTPIDFFDERYSTADAQTFLTANKRQRVPLDAAAAAVILQNYLNSKRDEQ